MKVLGKSHTDKYIVELGPQEMSALNRLAGISGGDYEWLESGIEMGPVLEKLSYSKLEYIVQMLRHAADRLEMVDKEGLP